MKDGYGRKLDYLRISVTDKCDMRCRYCMPEEGIRHLSHGDVLSFEEIVRIAGIMKDLGIKKIRLTGGEPLVRRGITELIGMLPCDVYLTTNGCRLADMARQLAAAGLRAVNVSLDSLDADTFFGITGIKGPGSVLAGIEAAKSAGLPVKLNCVPIRGINENEIEKLCEYAESIGSDIRFIELMPIGCGSGFEGVPSDEIKDRLQDRFGKAEEAGSDDTGPAVYYRFGSNKQKTGFISPMTHRFCSSCNRIRMTAEGFLKLCLQYPAGIDLRALLRSGADDAAIRNAIADAVLQKPVSHNMGRGSGSDDRKMIQIGG